MMSQEPKYCYRYRMPGAESIVSGCSDRCLEQPEGAGFAISAFLPHSPLVFIHADRIASDRTIAEAFLANGEGMMFRFSDVSTAREDHAAEVELIRSLEMKGVLNKAVAARCVVTDRKVDIESTFRTLCEKYPQAFVFLFSTPETGTWMGASPELLLRREGSRIESVALAGTKPAGDGTPWDGKNIREQEIVTRYITECFREAGLQPHTEGPMNHQAGPVVHLKTEIRAEAPASVEVASLLDSLSPTPALCGLPRETAAETIADAEKFERAFYGGFCGPFDADGDFSLYVNLRSGWFTPERYCLIAGGGIMPESDADAEWTETERKLSTLENAIKEI